MSGFSHGRTAFGTAAETTDGPSTSVQAPLHGEVLNRWEPLVIACWGTALRPMEPGDVAAVCDIHRRVFPDYFLTRLGRNVLECYYRGVLQYEHSYAVVYQEANTVKGFFTGLFAPDDFYRFMVGRFGFRLAMAVLPGALRPSVLRRLLRAVWNALHTSELTDCRAETDCEMTSMGILPEAQGRMAGILMVVSFMLEAKRRRRRKIAGGVRREERSLLKMYQLLGFEFAGLQHKSDGKDIQLISCVL